MDLYKRLRSDHAAQSELANRLLETSAEDERRRLYERFKRDVESHALAEQQTLYATLLAIPGCHAVVQQGILGHKLISDILISLARVEFSSPEWKARFMRLRDELEFHSNEEEELLFPAARGRIEAAVARKLGIDYAARKRTYMLEGSRTESSRPRREKDARAKAQPLKSADLAARTSA